MSNNNRQPRKVWSKQENLDLVYCYYCSNPGTSGSWKRLERLWEDKGYDPLPGKKLAGQFRSIEKSENMVTPQEMAEQRMAATGLNILPIVDLTVDHNTAGPSTSTDGDATDAPNPPRATRTKWTKEMNSTLAFIHWYSQPEERGLWNRVEKRWSNTTYPRKTASQLRSQFKSITETGLLSPQYLMEIRESAKTDREDMNSIRQAELGDNPPPEVTAPITPAADEEPAPNPEIREQFRKLLEEPSAIKVTDLRQVPWGKLRVAIDRLSPVIKSFEIPDLATLNTLLLVVAHVVREQMGIKPPSETTSNSPGKNKEPMWLRRLEESVAKLRSDLSRLTEMSRGATQKFRTIDTIYRRYPLLPKKGYKQVIEEVKQRLLAKAGKIKRYKKKQQTFKDNNLFQNNQRDFYRKLEKRGSVPAPVESTAEDQARTLNFWKDIWENEAGHNTEAEWLDGIQGNFEPITQQEDFQITTARVAARVKGMTNWSSPGIDGLHAFWIKHTTCLHGRIAELLNESLTTSQIPAWMTEGRTYLLIKDPKKGTSSPGNFRPITCLPNLWKLYTGIISEDIYHHLDANKLFPEEQKGCRKKSRGCKEQLAIDKLILRHCKRTKSSLYMAFIDYQKAYDSIPHSWILKSMEMCKINPQIVRLFERSFQQCIVNVVQSGSTLGKIHIKRGLFQGDAVSPIHFIIGLIPLSLLLTAEGRGYTIAEPDTQTEDEDININHRLYMDDLKLYANSRENLQHLLEVTEKFSTDINMSFGIAKCGSLDIVNGVRQHMQGIELPSGNTIPEVEDGGYKYLGILEVDVILHQEMKTKVKIEYIRRVKRLLSSSLHGKNLVTAINTWAIPVIRYGAGILDWTATEAKGLDMMTRKILRRGFIKSNSDIDRLYVSRKLGGRGLQRIEDVIVKEETGLVSFFSNSTDTKIRALHTAMVKEDMLNIPPENAEALKERLEGQLIDNWKGKPLHGRFLKQLEEGGCDPDATWAWLNKESLSRYTEADVFAAQDQSIRTNWIQAAIEKQQGVSEKCRICNQHNESVEHILNGCQKLANGDYKHRHDRVAAALHWGMCRDLGFTAETKWWSHYAEKVLENDDYKILWDFLIQTDNPIEACKPDLVLLDKRKKEALLIDVAVPKDRLVSDREVEKIEKYQELRREITRIWELKKATVIPIVIGALGGVSPRLEKYLQAITRQIYPSQLQKSVLFNSMNTLRKVLDM